VENEKCTLHKPKNVTTKRNGKYLQGLEDNFKEVKEGNGLFKQQGQRMQ